VLAPTEVAAQGGAAWQVPGMALASWSSPRREPRRLRVLGSTGRGWWLEVERA
jgi:glycine/D-amino acid oxidase-like deaminating enzyme